MSRIIDAFVHEISKNYRLYPSVICLCDECQAEARLERLLYENDIDADVVYLKGMTNQEIECALAMGTYDEGDHKYLNAKITHKGGRVFAPRSEWRRKYSKQERGTN